MNKYLLEVEAIQFTGDNAIEIEKGLSECLDLTKSDIDIEVGRFDGEEWLGFSDGNNAYEINVGNYIIVAPKKRAKSGYLLATMSEKEFEQYARRLY